MAAVREIPLAETRSLRRAVLRPHQSFENLASQESADAFAAGAFDGDELVAVGFILPDGGGDAWRVRGMAAAPHARGRGAGSAILDALVEHARSQGATRIWCNVRVPARRLYERRGFETVSEEFVLPEIGPHVRMELRPVTVRPTTSPVTSQPTPPPE